MLPIKLLISVFLGCIMLKHTLGVSIESLDQRMRILEGKVYVENAEFRNYFDVVFEHVNRGAHDNTYSNDMGETDTNLTTLRLRLEEDFKRLKYGFKAEKSLVRHSLDASVKHVDDVKEEFKNALKTMENEFNMISARNRDICTDNVNQLRDVTRLHELKLKEFNVNLARNGDICSENLNQLHQVRQIQEQKLKSLESKIEGITQENVRLRTLLEQTQLELSSDTAALEEIINKKLKVIYNVFLGTKELIHFNGSIYVPGNKILDWEQARDDCERYGGMLPEVDSQSENEFLFGAANKVFPHDNREFWLGGSDSDLEGTWKWVNSGRLIANGFSNWAKLQPDNWHNNEHCIHIVVSQGGRWNDDYCTKKKPYICEFD